MILLDIININNDIKKNSIYNIKFYNNYNNKNYNNTIFQNDFIVKNLIEKEILFKNFIGEGSYGQVFKIKIDNNYYAIKFSENEIPKKLFDRYNSLINNSVLKNYTIKIFCAGEIKSDFKYPYYSIMEFGGKSLRSYLSNIENNDIRVIINQLHEIVSCLYNDKILMTDFKLSNMTIDSEKKIKLIDIYLYCDDYFPCKNCKIVKTYPTIEIEKEYKIYEDTNYNYSCIFIPFAVVLIDLICQNTVAEYTKKICKKYNLDISLKELIPLLQISCYNFINSDNDPIKHYTNLYKYKKKLEKKYAIIKEPEFYDFFVNLLEPKKMFNNYISKKKLCLIVTDLLSIDPYQRSLRFFKKIIL